MRVLYITTIGGTMPFFKSFIRKLLDEGHTVDIASNNTEYPVPNYYIEWGCRTYELSCTRTPLNRGNIDAVKQIRAIALENHYDIIHCHTPIAAACTRIACRKLRKKGLRVFYTAHGFHFYNGAPLRNWLLYYPIEWLCAHWTDTLITINREDYALAQKRMKAKRVVYVPGVGIDLEKFKKTGINKSEKRKEIGVPEDCILLLSVGELNENKNHETVIRAIAGMDVYYVIAGCGDKKADLENAAAEVGMANRIKLIGYREDVTDLYEAADIFCFPSHREGLGMAAIEAMACGLPLITSNVHGINDYSVDGVTGYKCSPSDIDAFAEAIRKLSLSPEQRFTMGAYNREVVKKYDHRSVIAQTMESYLFYESTISN